MHMQSNKTPTDKSETTSEPRAINSPEFQKSMDDELKDWIAKGHCKPAPGNYVIPTTPQK
jgi:hypothetical protein